MKKILCLMGPTASGKTDFALNLCEKYPFEIISVDSAMVYRGMNIGTAKPSSEILAQFPHRLIDNCDPALPYCAGDFRRDAAIAIDEIIAAGKTPLLVGGTMMYFRVLQQGLADLPQANSALRKTIAARAEAEGWVALHQYLKAIDPDAASRINCNDGRRIQRALEVYEMTGKPISVLQKEGTKINNEYEFLNFALLPEREILHQRIELRLKAMLKEGLIDEVNELYKRGDLHDDLPSIRSVGYLQVWQYLAGKIERNDMEGKILAATRQLAKRQMTWLRTWPNVMTDHHQLVAYCSKNT